jgi:hypothetical protein
MKGRQAYQRAHYQQIDEDVYMISWIEGRSWPYPLSAALTTQAETGTTVTTCVNLKAKTVNGFIAFAAGHIRNPNGAALGDKRDPETLERWRELAKIGNTTTDRYTLPKSPCAIYRHAHSYIGCPSR